MSSRKSGKKREEAPGLRFRSGPALVSYFLKGSLRDFLISMLFAFLVSLLDMLNPKIISFTVDSVIGHVPARLPAPLASLLERAGGMAALKGNVLPCAAAVVLVALLAAVFRYLFRVFNARGAESLVKRMRDLLYGQIQHLPVSWHSANSTGDIIQRCTSDVEIIKNFLSEQMTSLVRMVVLIVMAVTFMAGINARMTFWASLFIPVVVGYSLVFHTKIGDAFLKADVEEGRLSAIAQENLTGVRVVRAFGRETWERERFENQNRYYAGLWVRLIRILSVFWSAGDLITGLQLLLVMVLGARFCVSGIITAGDYIAFVSYNAMITWPVRAMGRVISEMSKAGISVDRLRSIMNAEREITPEDALKPPMDRDIVFSDVSFGYPSEGNAPEVLHRVSFTVPAGTTLGIIGPTGSGKSTLAALLLKLYPLDPVSGGDITIGGISLSRIDPGYLRSEIGLVMQEPYLFSRTLRDNIRIAAPDSGEEDLRRAVRIAGLEETVGRFPQGYETFVGERGVTLSGGQKQRTAIAQMLIRRTPVMIFDDSLSAVDAETDARIREALREETKGSTVLLIAHRIATVMRADHIIVLDGGRIAEEGTHSELMALGGIYRRICELQSGESPAHGASSAPEEAARATAAPEDAAPERAVREKAGPEKAVRERAGQERAVPEAQRKGGRS